MVNFGWTKSWTIYPICSEHNLSVSRSKSVSLALELFEEGLGADPCPGVDGELHLGNLPVDLLHEGDDEVDELVAEHLVRVEVGDQETVVFGHVSS